MTEDEANKKWCPFARVDPEGAAGRNRYPEVRGEKDVPPAFPITNLCIGSACMAWRGETKMVSVNNGPMQHQWHGFCGLAGKP